MNDSFLGLGGNVNSDFDLEDVSIVMNDNLKIDNNGEYKEFKCID